MNEFAYNFNEFSNLIPIIDGDIMKRHILVMLVIALLVTLAVPPKLAVAQDVTGLMIYAFCDYNANGMFDKKTQQPKIRLSYLLPWAALKDCSLPLAYGWRR